MFVFDFEVFKHDWLVVFYDVLTSRYFKFVNDPIGLAKFYEENKTKLFVGFNNKRYDNYIFKGILLGVDPFEISKIIIEENDIMKLFQLYDMNKFKFFSLDLAQDATKGSLKEFEGYMGINIDETEVDFLIDRPLTDVELNMTMEYCTFDVDATVKLMEVLGKSVQTKFDLIKEFGLGKNDLIKTNAQLSAKILGAVPTEFNDENKPFNFDILDISLNDTKGIIKEYVEGSSVPIVVGESTIREFFSKEYNYRQQLHIEIAGVPHIIAFGGLHGAKENCIYSGEMWIADVTSYYPSMMITYDFLSRAIPDDLRHRFKEIYDTRVVAKNEGNKRLANILKLIINTVYGAMKAKFNELYDPHNANNVCIAGQVMLVDLIEKLEPYITLVQSNTDGILFIPHNKTACKFIIKDWEERTGMKMEVGLYTKLVQKDVNNYIMLADSGDLELKGSFVGQSTVNNHSPRGLKKSAKIIDDAVVNYFVHDIKPEQTIYDCNDLLDFQIIRKTGRSYDRTVLEFEGKDIVVNKVNRVYASLDNRWGKLYKVKDEKVLSDGKYQKAKRDSHQTLPDHCELANKNDFDIKKLDRSYYINEAYKRINAFKEK